MVDSAGSNYGGIKSVFGIDYMTQKVISCQWHFMNVMEQFVHKIPEEDQEEFLQLCNALCKKTTIPEYQLVATRLHQNSTEMACNHQQTELVACKKMACIWSIQNWPYTYRSET